MIVAHGPDVTGREGFHSFMVSAGAHAMACVLSIHAIADVTAFAIYLALGYNLGPNPKAMHKVSAKSLAPQLAEAASHAPLAGILRTLLNNDSYAHVAALANHSKHRSLVKPAPNED